MDWQLKKSSSKATVNRSPENAPNGNGTNQKLLAVVVTMVVLATILVLLWMVDPALVEIFKEHLEVVFPACLNYYMRT